MEDTLAVAVDDLKVEFETDNGAQVVLEGLHLDIPSGQFVSIIGPSGCGKSTLMRAIGGLIPPSAGHIEIYGKSTRVARTDRDFSLVFQAPALLEWRNALDNVALPLELKGVSRREARQVASGLLERVGLTQYARNYPRQLSGGMQQRVAIARALGTEPRLLLMDEPFGALDEITRTQMNEWLLDVWSRSGATVVFITHSIQEAVMLSDRIIVLEPHPGRVLADFDVPLARPRKSEVREAADFIALRLQGEQLLEKAAS